MKISKIHVRAEMIPFESGNQIAFGSIVIDEAFKIENIRLMKNSKTGKNYLSWPCVQKKNGYDSMCYLNDKECREICLEEVVKAAAYASVRSTVSNMKVYVTKVDKKKLVGLATVVYEFLTIKNIRIYRGKQGLTISFPTKMLQGEYKELCYPISKTMRDNIQKEVLEVFNKQ